MTIDCAFKEPSRSLTPAIVFSLLVIVGTLLAIMMPPARGETTVVFTPGTSEAEAWTRIRDAGGYVVGPAATSFAFIAYAPDAAFAWDMLMRGGLSLAAKARLCGPDIIEKV